MNITKYFVKELYNSSSKYNNEIKVISVFGKKKLIVNGITQSADYNTSFVRKRVWGKVSNKIINLTKPNNEVLILGLGAGSVIGLVNRKQKNIKFTGVEIDKKIIEVSRKYFDLEKYKNLEIYIQSASQYLNNTDRKFDLILVDTYVGKKFNESNNIFKLSHNRLKKRGYLIFNNIVDKNIKFNITEFSKAYLNGYRLINVDIVKYPAIADNYIITLQKF